MIRMINFKVSIWSLPMAAFLVAGPTFVQHARAEGPPVEVQIVAEGSEDDFLSPEAAEPDEPEEIGRAHV